VIQYYITKAQLYDLQGIYNVQKSVNAHKQSKRISRAEQEGTGRKRILEGPLMINASTVSL